MDESEIVRLHRALSRRQRLLVWRNAFLEISFFLSISAGILLLADRTFAEIRRSSPIASSPISIIAVIFSSLAISALAATALALSKRISFKTISRAIDKRMESEERFLTSIEMATGDRDNPFSDILMRETSEIMARIRRDEVLPAPPVGYRWGILLPLAIALFLLVTPYVANDGDHPASPMNASASANDSRHGRAVAAEDRAQPKLISSVPKSKRGDAPAEDIFGPKNDRPRVELQPEGIDPLIGAGKFVEKEKMVYTEKGLGEGKKDKYQNLFHSYKRVAESAMSKEDIPREVRDLVRRYFEEIKPE